MRHLLIINLGLLLVQGLSAEPELKGTATELAAHLASIPGSVVITAKLGVKLAVKRFSTLNNPTAADLRRANPDFEKTATFTGILSDPAFRVPLHALEQREDSTSLFGEISAKVLVTFEFVVESK